jgi:hypothetical protein
LPQIYGPQQRDQDILHAIEVDSKLTCLVAEMPNLVQITNFSLPWILMAFPTSSSL